MFTSTEVMVINSLVPGKNKIPALVKNPFCTIYSFQNICKFIFVWKVKEKTFPGNFFLQGKQNSPITHHTKPTLAKSVIRDADFEAIYHFSFNSYHYHTLAEIKSTPYQSSFIRFLPVLGQLWITQSVMFTQQTLLKHTHTML